MFPFFFDSDFPMHSESEKPMRVRSEINASMLAVIRSGLRSGLTVPRVDMVFR